MTVTETKLGGHVTTGPRDGWGLAAPHMRGVVSFLADAFVESDEFTFCVWRPNTEHGIYTWGDINDVDIMPGFDQLTVADMPAQAGYWWPKILAAVESEEARLGIKIDALQCTNEVGGNDAGQIEKLIAFEQALMLLAENAGRVLVIGNCATNSPGWNNDLWETLFVPHIRLAWQRGHIYGRHVYFDVPPLTDNYERIFVELEMLRKLGPTGPVIISETGFVNFPGNDKFMAAMKAFDERIAEWPEILFAAAFTYGEWKQSTSANIQSASAVFAAYMAARPFDPIFLGPVEPEPDPELTVDEVLWDESVKEQIERGIWLNPDAGLVQAILADGLTPVHRELYLAVLGKAHVVMAAEDMKGIIPRRVYEWTEGQVRWFGDPAEPPELPWDLLAYRPCDTTQVTQYFGKNPDKYDEYGLPGHEGLDYAVPLGQPFYAAQSGRVVHASDRKWSSNVASGYGWHVVIDHGDCCTVYGHAAPNLPVAVNQWVEAGQIVGYSGNTGNSDGPHLHFGLLDVAGIIDVGNGYPEWKFGRPVDPWPFVRDLYAPAQPATQSVDMLSFMKADPLAWRVVRHPDGSQEDFRDFDYLNGRWAMVKNNKAEWWFADDEFIYLKKDNSPAPADDGTERFYTVNPGRWCKRWMAVGETFHDGGHIVQFYNVKTCQAHPQNSGQSANNTTVVKQVQNHTFNGFGQNLKLDYVLFVQSGAETQVFARHGGKALGRVAWSSPWGSSEIVELYFDRGVLAAPPVEPCK